MDVIVVALAALGIAGYAWYKNERIRPQEKLAERIFYDMKELEVRIAALEQKMAQAGNAPGEQTDRALHGPAPPDGTQLRPLRRGPLRQEAE